MASATLEARIEMGETVIVNIRAFVDGHQPPHRVLPEARQLRAAKALPRGLHAWHSHSNAVLCGTATLTRRL